MVFFFFNDTAPTGIYTYGTTLSLHDALPIFDDERRIEGAALIIFGRAAHRFDVGGVEPVAGDDVAAVAVIVTEVDRNIRRERVVCEAAAVDLAANLLEPVRPCGQPPLRSEEHTYALQ